MQKDKINPLVSIVVNCYNGDEFLRFALESILSQTYDNWEVVFWDNQSTDLSSNIFKSYKDMRFKYYFAKKHTVLYEARNAAIEKCKGDLIAFLDVDDIWLPEKLKIQVVLFQDSKIGLSCTNYLLINERGSGNVKIHTAYDKLPFGKVLNYLLKDYFVHMSTLMVRKEAINELEYIFDSRFNIIGDLDFVIRLCEKWELATIQMPVAHYRWHENNTGYKSEYIISDEFELWKDSSIYINILSKQPNFKVLDYKIQLYKVLRLLYLGKRREVITECIKLSPKHRIKALVAITLPNFIVKKIL